MVNKAASALNKMRKRTMRVCAQPGCGERVNMLATQIYCSNRCKQRAKYARKKAESGG